MTELPTFRRTTLKIPRLTRPSPSTRKGKTTSGNKKAKIDLVNVDGVASHQDVKTSQTVQQRISPVLDVGKKATRRLYVAMDNKKGHKLQVQEERLIPKRLIPKLSKLAE